jgi:hypothetical protein
MGGKNMNKTMYFLCFIIVDLIAGCAPVIAVETAQPTLTWIEQESYIKELLKTNAGCDLPCWWGIKPGETSWGEAELFLHYLGVTTKEIKLESGAPYYGALHPRLSEFSLGFIMDEEQAGIVNIVFIGGNHGSTQNQRDFETFWESYSPKKVIGKYKIPSRVLLRVPGAGGPGNSGIKGYILWIFYDELGFMIRYDGKVADLPVYHICPELKAGVDDIDRISMTLQHPDHPLPLEWDDSILTIGLSPGLPPILPIQDATGISLENFYKLFAQDDKPACFDTPQEIWSIK